MIRFAIVAVGIIAIAFFCFVYAGINAMCDDTYWPDWS
jgi:hypothetical protein